MWIRSSLAGGFVLLAFSHAFAESGLPDGFVYLRETVPDIRQDVRYAGRDNFMRKRLPGYRSAECVLTEDAAKALGKVQNAATRKGFSLVVFDCYRPQRAVNAMVAWVDQTGGKDPNYFPRVARSELIRQGYIGAKSSHARGSTVDVSLEDLSGTGGASAPSGVCTRVDRETVDFGTPFDCFDPDSRTKAKNVGASARKMRQLLVELMGIGGFRNYPGEWWHFTLVNEPFPGRSFDFPIEPRKSN